MTNTFVIMSAKAYSPLNQKFKKTTIDYRGNFVPSKTNVKNLSDSFFSFVFAGDNYDFVQVL